MVAKGLGVKLEMQQITGANRIPFLLTDKVDIVISVMGLTPERAKQIQFTAPYANTFLAVYGAKDAPVSAQSNSARRASRPRRARRRNSPSARPIPRPTLCEPRTTPRRPPPTSRARPNCIATNSIVAQALAKQNPNKEFERKFVIRRSPAHMGVQMDQHNLVRWLDGFIFFNTMNGELDRLHRKYLDMPMDPLPTL